MGPEMKWTRAEIYEIAGIKTEPLEQRVDQLEADVHTLSLQTDALLEHLGLELNEGNCWKVTERKDDK